MADKTVRLKGYTELQRAFARADPLLKKELNATLRETAAPVRSDAESNARARIRRVGVKWSRMRVGVTRRAVYVAPRARGIRGDDKRKRRKFGDLLMDRAMLPALDAHAGNTEASLERMLDDLATDWER